MLRKDQSNFTNALLEGIARVSGFTLASKTSGRIRANSISAASSGRPVYRVTLVYICEQNRY